MVDGGRPAGEKWLNSFTANCYHQTCDAWAPSWDLRGAAQEAELFYAIGTDSRTAATGRNIIPRRNSRSFGRSGEPSGPAPANLARTVNTGAGARATPAA